MVMYQKLWKIDIACIILHDKRYFNNLQLYIAALAELIPSPYIIDLANTIECAKLEFNNPNFNHQKYRKIIFDAHSIIDKIGDNHE